jgi:hypothetical protein
MNNLTGRFRQTMKREYKKEKTMDKQIVVLIHRGIPYSKTIKYASERAKELGAKLVLLSALPENNASERMSVAICEYGPYETVFRNVKKDIIEFLERAVQFCLDNGITVDTRVETGDVEYVIKLAAKDTATRLIVVPAPTKNDYNVPFLNTVKEFAHNMLDQELRCPVVSVLSA